MPCTADSFCSCVVSLKNYYEQRSDKPSLLSDDLAKRDNGNVRKKSSIHNH